MMRVKAKWVGWDGVRGFSVGSVASFYPAPWGEPGEPGERVRFGAVGR